MKDRVKVKSHNKKNETEIDGH